MGAYIVSIYIVNNLQLGPISSTKIEPNIHTYTHKYIYISISLSLYIYIFLSTPSLIHALDFGVKLERVHGISHNASGHSTLLNLHLVNFVVVTRNMIFSVTYSLESHKVIYIYCISHILPKKITSVV